jgi:hypothetical protein
MEQKMAEKEKYTPAQQTVLHYNIQKWEHKQTYQMRKLT